MTLAPGTVFAGFLIERTLGVGGMGTVYLARHPRLPRVEALKLLSPELSYDPDFAVRFAREADIVARLSHPNIVAVNDRGDEDGQLWISMQFINGMDAEQALAECGGLMPAQRAVRIVAEIAAALDFAHRNGLWHRDVKPANILITPGHDDEPERVLLTDFGIAKAADEGRGLTKTGNVIATFDYAPPEQIEGRPFDHRVDIYALGCVLYKLLTGSVPYPGSTVAAAFHGHLNRPPPRPTERTPWLAPALDDVIAHAMAKNPDQRYPNCRALAADARSALASLPAAPPLPYSISVRRAEAGSGRSMVLGPVDTEGLTHADRDGLVELVRQSRLFDLPASLPPTESSSGGAAAEPAGDTITIAVRAGGRTGTVSYLEATSRRPAELDDLLQRLETRLPWQPAAGSSQPPAQPAAGSSQSPGRPPAGATIVEKRPESLPPYLPPPDTPPRPLPPPPTDPRAFVGADTTEPRPRRGRLVAALAATLLVVGAGVAAVIITNDDGRENSGGGVSNSADPNSPDTGSESAGESSPPSSSELGLPSGPPLADTVLVTVHEVDGNVDLYTVDSVTGTTQTRLTSDAARDTQPLISPDRSSVIYLSRQEVSELWVVASDGSGARPLFDAQPEGCDRIRGRAAWNPADQGMLAVVCLDDAGTVVLQLVTPSGERIRTLDPDLENFGGPWFSPDGASVVYWANTDAAADDGPLYVLATDGSGSPVQLTDPAEVGAAESAIWSPDGTRIAFHVELDGGSTPVNTEVVVMDADGSNPVQVAPADGIDQDPAWSPDGSMIVFKSDRADGNGVRQQRLWIMNADGSDVRLLNTEALLDGFDAAW